MDLVAFRIQVSDNGVGMSAGVCVCVCVVRLGVMFADDLQLLGTRHCTSKCASLSDLDRLKVQCIDFLTSVLWISWRGGVQRAERVCSGCCDKTKIVAVDVYKDNEARKVPALRILHRPAQLMRHDNDLS